MRVVYWKTFCKKSFYFVESTAGTARQLLEASGGITPQAFCCVIVIGLSTNEHTPNLPGKAAPIPRRLHPPELGTVVELPEVGGLHLSIRTPRGLDCPEVGSVAPQFNGALCVVLPRLTERPPESQNIAPIASAPQPFTTQVDGW